MKMKDDIKWVIYGKKMQLTNETSKERNWKETEFYMLFSTLPTVEYTLEQYHRQNLKEKIIVMSNIRILFHQILEKVPTYKSLYGTAFSAISKAIRVFHHPSGSILFS